MDLFEYIVSGAVLLVMVLFAIMLVYLIVILRTIRLFLTKVRSGGEAMQRVGELLLTKLGDAFAPKKRTRKKPEQD